ncbi:uncharacterized protein LOC117642227 isoform X2 [Thrips palmi]|uniref:Uncharacterized protein LOC117642227 isoform X2 n=1 Tax=Thrips palmi TaxID=161013 RepID=A0A6P8YHK6_THRPL|nr:uncharacterized protein LOC117642227 isoform X2 [Thrips palmi]
MGVCSVIGCKSRSRERRMPHRAVEGITFHSFPSKNLDLRARWCMAVRGPGWAPSKFSKVCSKHFEERCFDRSGQTCRLRENAMPTQELDQTRLAMALTNTKMEVVEAPGVDSLTENGMQLQDTPSFANVVAQAVLNGGCVPLPGPLPPPHRGQRALPRRVQQAHVRPGPRRWQEDQAGLLRPQGAVRRAVLKGAAATGRGEPSSSASSAWRRDCTVLRHQSVILPDFVLTCAYTVTLCM